MRQAQRYVQADRHWVVDVDWAQFFDRVNHDILMGLLAKRIVDPRMLALIRRYLEAGVMVTGVEVERHAGTPQGGPVSPMLANVLLDVVDQELERRGHGGLGSAISPPYPDDRSTAPTNVSQPSRDVEFSLSWA
ncbi:hypothetical protein BH11GEM2_BH11GEM2_01020 [soil metagenome]